MRRIAVVTSGGDAPGMNAAIRAAVRTGIAAGYQMFGVQRGFEGLIEGKIIPLDARAVGGIIHQPGSMLACARSEEFTTDAGRRRAMEQLSAHGIEGLVVIGGSGSQKGALELSRLGLRVAGVASTIDNDLVGSEVTIGVDTALNIALEAIDRLRATGSSMGRAFLVEVMGRRCGYLALMAGIAGGAEAIVIPEFPCDPLSVALELRAAHARGKSHAIVVIAEGAEYPAEATANYFREHKADVGFVSHVTILGHIQRGGIPTAFDRILATRLGAAAVEHLISDERGVLVGLLKGEIIRTPLEQVASKKKPLDLRLLDLAKVLAK